MKRWIRCPDCGDSKKSASKKHCCIYPDGGSYCHRCCASHKVSFETLISIILDETEPIIEDWTDDYHERADRAESDRFTMLQPYQTDGMEEYVSFQMRTSSGVVTGWHNRKRASKEFINQGHRCLGYAGMHLVSSPSRPLIIVEGPYDVISDRHVCVFGMITSLKQFRLQHVWLQPDPDQLMTAATRAQFWLRVVRPAVEDHMVFVQGIIVGDADPDEATVTRHYTLAQGKEFIG